MWHIRKSGQRMAKPRTERSLLFPSEEFRERVRNAAKDRGFRSEQAFILAACENEIRRGENTDATTQFEARVAATLTNLAKQVQGLQTLAHAQVALTDVFLKYVITCIVEPLPLRPREIRSGRARRESLEAALFMEEKADGAIA